MQQLANRRTESPKSQLYLDMRNLRAKLSIPCNQWLCAPMVAFALITQATFAQDKLNEPPHFFHQVNGHIKAVWIEDGQKEIRVFPKGEEIRDEALTPWLGDIRTFEPHSPPPSNVAQPDKVFVISDVEGQFETMRTMLRSNGVIDEKDRWTFGKGHLVTVGDMVDRGEQVSEVLLMMWRLSKEAVQVGGRVNFIIGNHEAMCLGGDLRYVHPRYTDVCKAYDLTYDQLIGANTEIGRWLRSCPMILNPEYSPGI